jgi:plasmid stabilization system protein ParE
MRRVPVRLSRNAERWFLNRIAEIAEQNPSAARKILLRMERLKDVLSSFPHMTERGILPGTRKIVMTPFILTARFRNGVVEIAAIRHARQEDARAPSDLKEAIVENGDDGPKE